MGGPCKNGRGYRTMFGQGVGGRRNDPRGGNFLLQYIISLKRDVLSRFAVYFIWYICVLFLGFPFAKLLRNFCGKKRKIFLSLRISFARKNSNLRNHSQKSFRAKLPYSAYSQLKFCAIPQFRYNHMCVFLGIERFFAGI